MLIDRNCYTVFLGPRKYLPHLHLTRTGNIAGECPENFTVVLTHSSDYYPHFTCEETEAQRGQVTCIQTQVCVASKFVVIVVQPWLWWSFRTQGRPATWYQGSSARWCHLLDTQNALVFDLRLRPGLPLRVWAVFFWGFPTPFQQSHVALLSRIASIPCVSESCTC